VAKTETQDVAFGTERRRRWTLVGLVMFSLVVTLATRTFHGTIPHSTTIQSSSSQGMRQHMDRDAVRWTVPVATLTVSQAPTFDPHVAPAGPPLPTLLLEENLHNLPPPSC
jgi:hypothetical protein